MTSASVQGYDEVLEGQFKEYIELSEQIGGEVKKQSESVKQALDAERAFLVAAAGRAKPSQDELTKMIKETSEKMAVVEEFANKNRSNKEQFNHLSSVSEGIGALGWVVAPSKPDTFVKDKINAVEFYTNRVLKDNKGDDKHADWVKAFIGALRELEAYIKKHHSTALTWGK